MDPSFHLRRGTVEDIPAIVRHRQGMMTEMGFGDDAGRALHAQDFAEFAAKAIPSGAFNSWVAESDSGEVVAGGAVYTVTWPGNPRERIQRRAFILNVFTEPAFRRKGIARALVQTMMEWCRAQGFSSVRLSASEMGRPLYQSLGFEPTHEMVVAL
jgi:GNAT superfamily N-acetyltransferase